jgi:hypothetical protein
MENTVSANRNQRHPQKRFPAAARFLCEAVVRFFAADVHFQGFLFVGTIFADSKQP